ncbi:MAG: heavy-metal-associated domain-containing protein [Bacteroidales bacterium]
MRNIFILIVAIISIAATPVTELKVKGSCSHCKITIERVANQQKGVSAAKWNSKSQTLSVKINPKNGSIDELSKAISKAGYDTQLHKGDDSAYSKLPACCKYRD